MSNKILRFIDSTLIDLGRQFKWTYLPPLMIYLAAGISGLTGIVGTFFVKDYLNLSAAFLAGLGFWAGIPWALKMPLGHLVDLIWNKKNYMVFVGASLISLSLIIMYGLIIHTEWMSSILSVETWFVISVLLAPIGYVVQDVVADAMTVEAVPLVDDSGNKFSRDEIKLMHTTMQTLGRFAIIGGTVLVALANVILFKGVDELEQTDKISLYGSIYIYALIIPIVSVLGIFLASYLKNQKKRKLIEQGLQSDQDYAPSEKTEVNWWILGGSLVFVIFTLGIGSFKVPFAQEIVFVGSMAIILFLMNKLVKELPQDLRLTVVGTAIIIFIFRAMPGPGPGLSWFEIDVLEFNEQFFSVLSLIASVLTLVGIILLRPFMANNSIARIIVILSVAGAILFLPSVGMYYGFHNWTSSITNGVVDAKFIAILNTALESPLGQVSMIPLLAWIAKNAPSHLKATFFAVFASFTNLALSASALGTKYLNEIYVITREVKDKVTNAILTTADYSDLGILLITVTLITLIIPIVFVVIIQKTRFKTSE
ncbi:membrane protein [Pelagibacteraceae bacterium GOM-A1]|nr:membrane protein [Pelagibacteraceae bacterium GOM-A1]